MTVQRDPSRYVGFESSKTYKARCLNGFWDRWIKGPRVLDIGYRGARPDALPIIDGAVGVELGLRGYDGLRLPFPDGSIDTIHSSHLVEHLPDPIASVQEWFRAIRVGGTIIIMVPSAFLYERRLTVPPSRWSPEHVRAFTPASLLALIESALKPNTYRVRHLADEDTGYNYGLPIDVHPTGALEIVCVIEKIIPPKWEVEP
jgi:SAM-dependent methyltransferase